MLHLSLTQWVMVITVVVLLLYDCYAVYTGGIQNTISYQVTVLSDKFPFIPFALGFLAGHFFGQLPK